MPKYANRFIITLLKKRQYYCDSTTLAKRLKGFARITTADDPSWFLFAEHDFEFH